MLKKVLMIPKELTMEYLNNYEELIFRIIPELKEKEYGFDQKNPWHIYDVWAHTKHALSHTNHDLEERVALLFHDIGKKDVCIEDKDGIRHFKDHAEASSKITKPILKRLNFDDQTISNVIFLIENHSKEIDLSKVNSKNIKLMKKLLHIQFCDAKAYNPEKIAEVLEKLDEKEIKLDALEHKFSNEFYR